MRVGSGRAIPVRLLRGGRRGLLLRGQLLVVQVLGLQVKLLVMVLLMLHLPSRQLLLLRLLRLLEGKGSIGETRGGEGVRLVVAQDDMAGLRSSSKGRGSLCNSK